MSNVQFWKEPRFLTSFLYTVIAACTLLGNFDDISGAFREAYARLTYGEKRGAEYIDGPRAMVADNLGSEDSLYFVSSGDVREKSAETAVIQAVNWQIMPMPLSVLKPESLDGVSGTNGSAFLTPAYDSVVTSLLSAPESLYEKTDERGGRALWRRKDRPASLANEATEPESCFREMAGLIPVAAVTISGAIAGGVTGILTASVFFSLLVMIGSVLSLPSYSIFAESVIACAAPWFLCRHQGREQKNLSAMATVFGVFVVFAFISLAHTFTTPYGLAITGGRAKLWFVSGFKNPQWFLEPSYPPGCAAITLGCYQTAGMCGEWLTQLIGCAFLAVTAGFVVGKCECCAKKFWVLSLFFVPAALIVGGQFYPEPVMALCVLAAWDRIRNGNSDWFSWVLLGAAGWFKNEGLVFAFAAWVAWRIAGGRQFAPIRSSVAGLILPLSWHIGCRICGVTLNDYAPVWQLSLTNAFKAISEITKTIFTKPWQHGFSYPVAIVYAGYAKWKNGKCQPGMCAALLFSGLSLLVFVCIYACSTADIDWHIRTGLPRLLWTPALVLAYELVQSSGLVPSP